MNSQTIQQTDVPSAKLDFGLLWFGQSMSLLGDQFLVIALPLFSVSVIGVAESQAVLLPFALYLPFLLIGLQAGVLVDRLPRRLTMIVCDAVQAVVFGLITLLALKKQINFPILMMLVAIAGTAVVFFQIAYNSFVPELFKQEGSLHKANSRLGFSESICRTLGPMVAGPVIALVGSTTAIGLNAFSFVISLLALIFIKQRAPAPLLHGTNKELGWMRRDIAEGLRFVYRHPKLEPVISCGMVYVVFSVMIEVTLVLFCLKHLKLGCVP
jgi:fucose permease